MVHCGPWGEDVSTPGGGFPGTDSLLDAGTDSKRDSGAAEKVDLQKRRGFTCMMTEQ